MWPRVVWLGLLAVWVFALASLLSFNPADPPSDAAWPANNPVRNWCGPVGAFAAFVVFRAVGWGAWMLAFLAGLGLAMPLFGRVVGQPVIRGVGCVLITGSVCGVMALWFPGSGPLGHMPGGELGLVEAYELSTRFGAMGAFLWLMLLGLVGLVVSFDGLVFAAPAWAWRRLAPAAKSAGAAAVSGAGSGAAATVRAGGGLIGKLARMARGKRPVLVRVTDLGDEALVEESTAKRGAGRGSEQAGERGRGRSKRMHDRKERGVRAARQERETPGVREDAEVGAVGGVEEESGVGDGGAGEDRPGAPQVYTEEKLREKIAALPVRFAAASRKVATEDDLRDLQNVQELEGYRFPGLEMLESPEENFTARLEEVVREQATALEAALRQYRIDGEVVGIESGPVITQYDVRLAPGTKVAALTAVSSDVARALRAVNIRIVSNQAGRDTVGVEVPNPTKERVRLRELMSNRDSFARMHLPMFLGKDASGEPLIADLTQMPHMLIAGTTGSGKSVCMNTIIMSFLYTRKPNELKLVLVDPKMVEMGQFKDIPHLMCPVITEMAKAAAILEWACKKMDERYELLAEAGVRDLAAYNGLSWEELRERFSPKSAEEEARIPRKLPYMVFVIDELADLMMTNKEVEGSIIRIAQKARAVGIHLILATQRPQANVVTGLIKSNMPCRITFKVASGMDSRIVLDQKGGELLLGQGDMLFLSPRSTKLTRAQGTLVDDGEIRRVVRFLRDVARPSFERQLVQLRAGDADEERIYESANNSSASLAAAQEDPMFDRAVEIVLETRRGSVSLLQRRLAIGYTRASRLIDLMGIAGIISEHKGSVARDVLITPEDWDTMKRLADEEAAQAGLAPVFSGTRRDGMLFPREGATSDGAGADEERGDVEVDEAIVDEVEEGSEDEDNVEAVNEEVDVDDDVVEGEEVEEGVDDGGDEEVEPEEDEVEIVDEDEESDETADGEGDDWGNGRGGAGGGRPGPMFGAA